MLHERGEPCCASLIQTRTRCSGSLHAHRVRSAQISSATLSVFFENGSANLRAHRHTYPFLEHWRSGQDDEARDEGYVTPIETFLQC